jgi:pyruvate/2-oxoacid:ferredoxin oxidoreductase beta subunit
MSQVMIRDDVPRLELLDGGHLACPGCAAPLAMRMVLKELGERTIVVLPACCWSVIAGPYPQSSLHVPLYHTAFATGAAVASGIRAALDVRGEHDTTVMVWAGDGGTFDIGLQALSGAAERNEDFLYVCYDNEAYMNTGIQRSSATPRGAWTTTTPASAPQATMKKDILGIMAAHRIPYAATAALSHPLDLLRKVRTAQRMRGLRFLHILSPCPPGWKYPDDRTIEISRMAVRNRVFPLLEVFDGTDWQVTEGEPAEPIDEYVRAQARFRHIDDDGIAALQADVDARWRLLQQRRISG